MKCPHCGNYLENTLYRALKQYRNGNIVVTNIDYILDAGSRIQAIIEEKKSTSGLIRGFQLVTLKKIAKCLKVPLLILFSKGESVKLYEYDTSKIVRSNPFYQFQDDELIFSGSIEELGLFLFENYLDVPQKKKKKEVKGWRK
ncbi:MAG: hypothetical protein H0Z28_07985 [Archaeoglobus sp.]|nr:hypothetical protein [Archaeoglobus sp.]